MNFKHFTLLSHLHCTYWIN